MSGVDGRFSSFPRALAARARAARLGRSGVPALLAHPDWARPAPVVIWMHGRTVSKELDPGRYLRWVRAGIAACAIDLPGHGERAVEGWDSPARTLDVVEQAVSEIDGVFEALADPAFGGVFDLDRAALGGMSAGGMVTLRRLCEEHPFRCAAVEATAGSLSRLYAYGELPASPARHPPERIARLDPMQHIDGWKPIPLLALHSRSDRLVPLEAMTNFLDALQTRYTDAGINPGIIELGLWDYTGAPSEHAGFGRFTNDAKNRQVAFLRRWLDPEAPAEPA